MKLKIFSISTLATALVAFIWMLVAVGPYMRETDQAWLLDGGMNIANGHAEITRGEFNFDKQFVSYYLTGLLFNCLPRPFEPGTLVLSGNIVGMILFWGSLFCLIAGSGRRLPLALVVTVILTPCFLVYSPFYASAFTSVSFVLLLALVLGRPKRGAATCALAFLLSFFAVGARTDAILLLPLLAMLHSPRPAFGSVLKNPSTWLMALGGLLAFFLGRALYLAPIIDFCPVPNRLKVLLAYVVFGLGAAVLLLIVAWFAIFSARKMVRSTLWLAFLGLGLFLPMGYACFQLLTPRHCTVVAISAVIFLCARRGRIMLRNFLNRPILGTPVRIVLVTAAVLPVIMGVDLSDVHHPRITCTQPTLIPTGAGVTPAGAYLAFAFKVRNDRGFLDHNQATWAAANATTFEAEPDGSVFYLSSPLEGYLKFAMRLQGRHPVTFAMGALPWPKQYYAESRSLMRFQYVYPAREMGLDEFFTNAVLEPATGFNWHGITIFRTTSGKAAVASSRMGQLWALNTIFGPDEFRLEPVGILQKIPSDLAGKKLVLACPEALNLATTRSIKYDTITNPILGTWHICEISPLRTGDRIELKGAAPEKVVVATSAFPDWMSLQ